MKADSKTEGEIAVVLERFRNAVVARNFADSLELFSDSKEVFLAGSEAGEIASGPSELRAFFKRIYARPLTYRFDFGSYSVNRAGNMAWVWVDGTVTQVGKKSDSTGPYRMSIILRKHRGRWLIVHYHGSEPARR